MNAWRKLANYFETMSSNDKSRLATRQQRNRKTHRLTWSLFDTWTESEISRHVPTSRALVHYINNKFLCKGSFYTYKYFHLPNSLWPIFPFPSKVLTTWSLLIYLLQNCISKYPYCLRVGFSQQISFFSKFQLLCIMCMTL